MPLSPFTKRSALAAAGAVFLTFGALAEPKNAVPVKSVVSSNPKYQLSSNKETLEYDMNEVEADQIMREADATAREAVNAYQGGSYEKAISLYLKARDILVKGGARDLRTKEKIESCRQAVSQCYFFWAEKLYFEAQESASVKQFDQAIENCRKAAEMWPPEKERMEKAILRFQKMRESAVYQNKVSESAVLPDKAAKLYSIDVLLKQAETLYKDGLWDKARDKFEDVITRDPYNARAIAGIRNVNYRLLSAGRARREMVHTQMIAETEWKVLTPLAPRLATPPGRAAAGAEPIVKELKKNHLLDKLRNIKLDQISFEDIELPVIIRHIRQRSKELDPEKIGVNILLVSGAGLAPQKKQEPAAPGMEPNPEGVPTQAEAPAAVATDTKKYTLGADVIPLVDALKMLSRLSGYRMRVDDYAVVFAAPNVPMEQVDRRSYPYDRSMIAKLPKDAFGDAGGTGDAGGGTTTSGAVGNSPLKKINPEKFFGKGIPFTDPGTGLYYNYMTNRLIVLNTPENLLRVEANLRKRKPVDAQVLIQTKFSEVQLNDLEELGFQYLVSRQNSNVGATQKSQTTGTLVTSYSQLKSLTADNSTYNIYNGTAIKTGYDGTGEEAKFTRGPSGTWYQYVGTYTNNGAQSINMQNFFADNSTAYLTKAPMQEGSGQKLSFGQNAVLVRSYNAQNSTVNDVLFNGSYYNQYGYKINATVTALDQADSTDILACPRVTTMNGYDAVIKMVEFRYLPNSWSEATLGTIAVAGGNVPLFTPSLPSFGLEPLGITLGVKPQVDADAYTITMVMSPSIRQWTGWTDYSYQLTDTAAGKTVVYTNILKMPIIETRQVDTSVQCFDGETIVLGGVIKDETAAVDDQYPILGNIPVVGRLFQTKSKSSRKKNLLIFMSCRLINPDGSPLREREIRGLPPFRQ